MDTGLSSYRLPIPHRFGIKFSLLFISGMKRSHHCNQLRKDNAGSSATLIGWIDSLRDHGGVFFLDLRPRGQNSVVLDPENQTLSELFPKLKPESVIEVSGEVRNRDQGTENANLDTGDIELFASNIIVHNQSKTPPSLLMIPQIKLEKISALPTAIWTSAANPISMPSSSVIGHPWPFVNTLTIRTFSKSRLPCFSKARPKVHGNFWCPAV